MFMINDFSRVFHLLMSINNLVELIVNFVEVSLTKIEL